MSALGQKRRFRNVRDMSGLPQTADIIGPGRYFAFVPEADIAGPLASTWRVHSGTSTHRVPAPSGVLTAASDSATVSRIAFKRITLPDPPQGGTVMIR